MLYDANGVPIFEGGVRLEEVRAAVQAAALADEWGVAQEIADRYGLTSVCLKCAIKGATTAHYDRDNIIRRVCITCFHELDAGGTSGLNFSSVKAYMHGLIKRNVV